MVSLFLFKLLAVIFFVVLLTLVAERVSPKLAGLMTGLPTGQAILLFFFGLEMGPDFQALFYKGTVDSRPVFRY